MFALTLNFYNKFQSVRLSGDNARQCLAGLSFEVQPLLSKRAGPELQSSRRLWSEVVGYWTQDSQVWTDNMLFS